MKAFDHSNPTTKDEWVFAFAAAHQRLRPEIGERYAKTHAVSAYNTHKDVEPAKGGPSSGSSRGVSSRG